MPGHVALHPSSAILHPQTRAVCRTSFDALVVLDDERRYVRLNACAARLLGAPVEAILSRRMEHFTPRERWPLVDQFWLAWESEGWLEGTGDLLRADGRLARVEFRATWDFASGQHLMAARDLRRPLDEDGHVRVATRPPRRLITDR